MKGKIAVLALLTTLGYACSERNKNDDSYLSNLDTNLTKLLANENCRVKNLMAQEGSSYDELSNQLLKLVKHDWDFIIGIYGNKNYGSVSISIPATDATDDRISGKGSLGNEYSPNNISPEEGYMVIGHSLCQPPSLIINGANISGNPKRCANDPACIDELVKHIRSIDKRNGNTFYADQIKYYANAVEKRYNHGIKRK